MSNFESTGPNYFAVNLYEGVHGLKFSCERNVHIRYALLRENLGGGVVTYRANEMEELERLCTFHEYGQFGVELNLLIFRDKPAFFKYLDPLGGYVTLYGTFSGEGREACLNQFNQDLLEIKRQNEHLIEKYCKRKKI